MRESVTRRRCDGQLANVLRDKAAAANGGSSEDRFMISREGAGAPAVVSTSTPSALVGITVAFAAQLSWIEREHEKRLTGIDRWRGGPDRMIRITISVEAFEAIAATLPLGSVGDENDVNERGERLFWLAPAVLARPRPCVDRARASATSSSVAKADT
jgi:hypothetical protein